MKVLAYPRDANPYQELLYGELRACGVEVSYVGTPTPSHTLNLLLLPGAVAAGRLGGARLLHLHWVYPFVLPGADRVPALRWAMQGWFTGLLRWCRLLGVRVVWTAHNVLPHDRVFGDDRAARRTLLRCAAAAVVHSRATQDALAELLDPSELPPTVVVPHGPYVGAYPDVVDRAGARDALGLPADAVVLTFFGRIQAYKGVEELVAAFGRLVDGCGPGSREAVLVVAGECGDAVLAERLRTAQRRIGGSMQLHLGAVADERVQHYLRAADAVVLPFRAVTTSGSAQLALGFERPVIVPDLPGLADLPDPACIRYPGGVDGLHEALRAVLRTPEQELTRRGASGRAWLLSRSWADAAAGTEALFRAVVSQPGAVRPGPGEAARGQCGGPARDGAALIAVWSP